MPVTILRLGGIYGPGQNGMVRLLRGTVHRIAKPGHVSNRVHVHDIAQAIEAAFERQADGVFNVVDDEPAPPTDQIAFAARLLGIDAPPEIPYSEAGPLLSPLALSFYDGCIRARNDKLKNVLDRRSGARVEFLPVGIRIGSDAMERLKAQPRELAVVYYGGDGVPCPCPADGLMLAIGASPGQGTVQVAAEKNRRRAPSPWR